MIIAVYCSGTLILVARNIPKFNKNQFIKNLVIPYVPIMPAIQVSLLWKITAYFVFKFAFQFFIYIAWLSFGRAAVNPFGEDDTDVNIKELAQKHQNVS